MENVEDNVKEEIINKVCSFLHVDTCISSTQDCKDAIKEICTKRLCKAIGLTGICNFKSSFFDFFSNIMGEAVCEKLSIKLHIAPDELRLVKYNHINLVGEVKSYLDNKMVEEAFLDAFELVDNFKYLIPMLKKPSES